MKFEWDEHIEMATQLVLSQLEKQLTKKNQPIYRERQNERRIRFFQR